MLIIYSPKCIEYRAVGHPESPTRVSRSYEFLKDKGYTFISPGYADEATILSVHTSRLVTTVKSGNFYDPDTPALPGIYDYASLAVGAAIKAMELSLKGDISFSLMRPPGHHAGKDTLGGFCYFNNIAVAVKLSGKRCAILDIDCHHGNGTEGIFLGDTNVLYVSLHRYGFFYPGTGGTSYQNALNFPMPADTTPDVWFDNFHNALDAIRKFNPELLAISAGFDTYKGDPIAGLGLEVKDYYEIGRLIKQLNLPIFAVLEGGYSDRLPECIHEFLKPLK